MDLSQIAAVESVTGERILDDDHDLTPCPRCGGTRKIQTTYKGVVTDHDCTGCDGTGNLEGER